MDPMSFLIEVKQNFLNEHRSYDVFLQTIKDFREQKIDINLLIKDLTNLFHGKQTLILGFNEFLPEKYKIVSKEDEEALSFVKRVKAMFKDNHEAFLKFLQIMDSYSKNNSVIEVYKEVDKLFHGHNDMFIEFKTFLPNMSVKSLSSPPFDTKRAVKKRKIEENFNGKRTRSKGLTFFDKVKAASDSEIRRRLSKCTKLYSNKLINRQELQELVDDLIGGCPELIKGFDEYMEKFESNVKPEVVSLSKSMEENIKDLDLMKCEEICPSYRLMPMNCRYPAIRHESLSDGFVCVPPPERTKFKGRPTSRNEHNLFKCEDEMFRMDMEKHLIINTISSIQDLLGEVKESYEISEKPDFCLEEQVSITQLKYIKGLFSEKVADSFDYLRVHGNNLLPTVLKKLILRQLQLAQIYTDSKLRWRGTLKGNH